MHLHMQILYENMDVYVRVREAEKERKSIASVVVTSKNYIILSYEMIQQSASKF